MTFYNMAALAAVVMIAGVESAYPQETPKAAPASLGVVRPGNLVLPQMAVQIAGDGSIGQTIQKDLNLAAIAEAPRDDQAASAAAQADRGAQTPDYDAWTRAGVTYVLRGVSTPAPQVELYDIASRRRILGKSYAAGNPVQLAHKIADDCMQAITGAPGIFSSRLALLVGPAKGNREVATVDPDGSNLRTITQENSIVATPAWGRNGGEVFFTSYKDNNPDLYSITLDGRRVAVSRRPGLNISPSWNETTGKLAVTLGKDGNSEIYTMNADGSGLARVTQNTQSDTAPVWSPDGSRIAFTSDESGSPQIYIMDARGAGRSRISAGSYSDSPSWSPDGSKLAYVTREKGGFNLYMVDVNGGAPKRLTTTGDNMEPTWAANSKHLAFTKGKESSRDIWLMNTDSRATRQITKTGRCSSPIWGPIF